MRILFVCLGNICRSPMAEGILRKKAQEKGLGFEVDSCGTTDHHEGENPDPRAQEEMRKRGVDISDLVARRFHPEDFERFDRIYTMDERNHRDVLEHAPDEASKAKAAMLLSLLTGPEEASEVPDPYFGAEEGFKTVYELLEAASERILDSIEDEPESKG
jgi:protein-tyrosine phosphatase